MTMAELPAYLAMRLRNIANVCRRTVLTNLFRWGLSYANSGKRPIPRWLFRPVEANDLIRRRTKLTPYEGDAVLFQTAPEMSRRNEERSIGWRAIVKGRLTVVPIPGEHFQIVKEPHVRDLAAKLARAIREVDPT